MTFINTSTEKTLQINNSKNVFSTQEQTEVIFFNKVIFIVSIVLITISIFFIYNIFFQNKVIENKHDEIYSDATLKNPDETSINNLINTNSFNNEISSPSKILLNTLEENNIFRFLLQIEVVFM